MSLQLTVPDMACAACSETITKALKTLDPTAQVTADSQTKLVTIEIKLNFFNELYYLMT